MSSPPTRDDDCIFCGFAEHKNADCCGKDRGGDNHHRRQGLSKTLFEQGCGGEYFFSYYSHRVEQKKNRPQLVQCCFPEFLCCSLFSIHLFFISHFPPPTNHHCNKRNINHPFEPLHWNALYSNRVYYNYCLTVAF